MNLLKLYSIKKDLMLKIVLKMDGEKQAHLVGRALYLSSAMYRLAFDSKSTPAERTHILRNIPVKVFGLSEFVPIKNIQIEKELIYVQS